MGRPECTYDHKEVPVRVPRNDHVLGVVVVVVFNEHNPPPISLYRTIPRLPVCVCVLHYMAPFVCGQG